jgi:hypothetical protein
MLKRHTFWLKLAAAFQILTAALHSLSFIMKHEPANETEKQLLDLMYNYKMDDGMGFGPTFQNLFTSMSMAFTLLLLFGGIINIFLLRNKAEIGILKGMTSILFGICFAVMATLTFLPPIICTGLIFVALLAARLTFPKEA